MILSLGVLVLIAAYGVSPWFLLLLLFTWIPDITTLALFKTKFD